MTAETRIETDSIGPVNVPAQAYWGAQTQRSIENFPFPANERMPMGIVYGLAHIKRAAALVHQASGAIEPEIASAIVTAAEAIISGKHDDHFPLAIWQTGSGTQSNMNVNEVIAGIANEALTGIRGGKSPVHPNDHVNKAQSSNDSFPTAIHIAVAIAAEQQLRPALSKLISQLRVKQDQWQDIVKIGRTHLQDATPLTLGQEFSGYVQLLKNCDARFAANMSGIHLLAQGGTAVGTGLNAPGNFGEDIAAEISRYTGIQFQTAPNKFEALSGHDALADFSGQLNGLAISLTKIANDIRLLGSGPRSGLGELILPANEPGSSIMPGKVNPTQCEMLTMATAQVMGNHQAVIIGAMQGHLELNVFKPLIGANVLRSITLLAVAMESFADRCIAGLEPNRTRINELVERSLMLVTALAPVVGYDNAAKIAKYADENGTTLREAALLSGLVDEISYDKYVIAADMTGPEKPQ